VPRSDDSATTTLLGDGSHVNACICQSKTEASNSGVTFGGVSGVSGVIGHGVSLTAADARVADRSHDVVSGCSRSTTCLDVDVQLVGRPLSVCPSGVVAVANDLAVTAVLEHDVTGDADDDVSDDVTINAAVHAQTKIIQPSKVKQNL